MTQENNQLPAVARNINLPCKKCGVDRYHVVVAHTSETSAKVKCEVCGAQKAYKLPSAKAPKKSASGTKTPGTRTSRRGPDPMEVWTELKTKIGTEKVQPYSMRNKFNVNTALEHPKFGVGFVTLVTNEKIEVTFQEGGRALVHNRP